MDNRPLTGKQKLFVNAYLGEARFNATEAARLAGYKGDSNTLAQIGHKMINHSKIAEAIAVYLQSSAMTADEVVRRLADYARADYERYFNADGQIDLERLLADGKGHLIKGIYPTKYGIRVEFYDAKSAFDTLAKHLNLLTDRVQQTNIDINPADLTDEQLKRLAAGEDILDVLVGD